MVPVTCSSAAMVFFFSFWASLLKVYKSFIPFSNLFTSKTNLGLTKAGVTQLLEVIPADGASPEDRHLPDQFGHSRLGSNQACCQASHDMEWLV
jgi:hypothetical protein